MTASAGISASECSPSGMETSSFMVLSGHLIFLNPRSRMADEKFSTDVRRSTRYNVCHADDDQSSRIATASDKPNPPSPQEP